MAASVKMIRVSAAGVESAQIPVQRETAIYQRDRDIAPLVEIAARADLSDRSMLEAIGIGAAMGHDGGHSAQNLL